MFIHTPGNPDRTYQGRTRYLRLRYRFHRLILTSGSLICRASRWVSIRLPHFLQTWIPFTTLGPTLSLLTFRDQPQSLRWDQVPYQHLPSIVHHVNDVANQLRSQNVPLTLCHRFPLAHHRLRYLRFLPSESGKVHPLKVKQKHMAFSWRHQRRSQERRQRWTMINMVHGRSRRICHGESSAPLLRKICNVLLPHLTLTPFRGGQRQLGLEPMLEMTLGTSRWSHVFVSCHQIQFQMSISS